MNALRDDSCPEPAVLGAFMDGTLSRERVADVTRHVSRCARCRVLIENAAEVEQELGDPVAPLPVPEPSPGGLRWIGPMAASLLLVAIVVIVARNRDLRPAADPFARLVAAAPTLSRTIEPRLSGGFRWAPLRAARRADPAQKTPEELVASGAAGAVLRDLGGKRTPQALHASGAAYLVAGDAETAVTYLEQAVRLAEGNARVWSDLSAALLMAAKPDDRARLQRALMAADRAIRLNPRLAEAYFNRALALERVGTSHQTAAAWRDYLQRDPSGAWSAEARERLAHVVP